MSDNDFHKLSADLETKRLVKTARRIGIEPPHDFVEMFALALAKQGRQEHKKRKAEIDKANERDRERTLLQD